MIQLKEEQEKLRSIYNNFEFMASKPLIPQTSDPKQLFDYRNEAFVMVCAFNSLEDYDAIDPARFGFDDKFIVSLNLDELTTQQILDNFADYHNYIHKDYTNNADEDYTAMPDFQFLKNVIEDFLVVLQPKDAYVLYREIVKRFEFLK